VWCGLEQQQGLWTLHHPPITSPFLMSRWVPLCSIKFGLPAQYSVYKHSNILAACSWQTLANSIHSFDHAFVRLYKNLKHKRELSQPSVSVKRCWARHFKCNALEQLHHWANTEPHSAHSHMLDQSSWNCAFKLI